MNSQSENTQKDEDENAVFGKIISKEMKQFSKVFRFQFKHDVNDLLYKYQLCQLQDEGADVTAQTSTLQFQSGSNSVFL